MGSGISSLARLRKAVLIRAYNLRASDQTLIDQFMPFTYQKDGKGLHISIHQIKKCLKMDSPEYKWVEEVLQAVFTVPTTPPTQKVSHTPHDQYHEISHIEHSPPSSISMTLYSSSRQARR